MRSYRILIAASLGVCCAAGATAATVEVQVGGESFAFSPSSVNIQVGDTVRWNWANGGHTVTSGNGNTCAPDGQFDTPVQAQGTSFSRTFTQAGQYPYLCKPHCGLGMIGVVNVAAAPTGNPPVTLKRGAKQIVIPADDRFTPFSLTIRAGATVAWINQDSDDHTVVSDDIYNKGMSRKLKNIDHVIKGTTNNGGQPGIFQLRFTRPGTFVYHCRLHSHVDASNQPVAPGPGEDAANPTASGITGNDGGIPNTPAGNFGTPMMGVITVLPRP